MHARDSAGRQVSLLNNDDESVVEQLHVSRPRLIYRPVGSHASSYASISSSRSGSSSPMTPELIRSDSYDSRTSSDPTSPLTPTALSYEQAARAQPFHHHLAMTPHDDYPDSFTPPQRPTFAEPKYNDDDALAPSSSPGPMPIAEKAGKRYPCRYRDTHGCDKTFTTSGHASRHSKIHTAEKAVQCTYPNCSKKFTRADNMKQHLETHYKDRSRSSVSLRSLSSSKSLSSPTVRRSSLASSARSASSASITTAAAAAAAATAAEWDMDPYRAQTVSPTVKSAVAWDTAALQPPPTTTTLLAGRPVASRTPSGLEALALAIACQEHDEI